MKKLCFRGFFILFFAKVCIRVYRKFYTKLEKKASSIFECPHFTEYLHPPSNDDIVKYQIKYINETLK